MAKPRLFRLGGYSETVDSEGRGKRYWHNYQCGTCGGVVMTLAWEINGDIRQMWPESDTPSETIPERARAFLKQALDSLHAPSGAQVLAASSVDAMLKQRGYKEGTLFSRIKQAEADHLITAEMALWAHEVRLDANGQRHADDDAPLPTRADAEKTIEFAKALAQFLFVLPALVSRGRGKTGAESKTSNAAAANVGVPSVY